MYTVTESNGKYLVTKNGVVVSEHSNYYEARAYANTLIHNLAVDTYISGDIDLAWEIAKTDTGLAKGATKELWFAYVVFCASVKRDDTNVNYE